MPPLPISCSLNLHVKFTFASFFFLIDQSLISEASKTTAWISLHRYQSVQCVATTPPSSGEDPCRESTSDMNVDVELPVGVSHLPGSSRNCAISHRSISFAPCIPVELLRLAPLPYSGILLLITATLKACGCGGDSSCKNQIQKQLEDYFF
ncbi:hypothetical protein SESBI_22637 [Sesbania bispinosa]|nr:hypothetical protein SESBI_22637 [Sesbania bispinosa]